MGRLIDADKLKTHYSWWTDETKELFDTIINLQPTIEAEPIVRCKDCAYWGEHYEQGCGMADYKTEPNHFCSWGERKK